MIFYINSQHQVALGDWNMSLVEDENKFILRLISEYHGYWCSSEAKGKDISGHGINLAILK